MQLFMPERVFFDPQSLKYPLGRKLYDFFSDKNIEIAETSLRNVSRSIPGSTQKQKYAHSKKTLVVTTKRAGNLDVCKPSADFEFSVAGSCPGSCEYCYLQTSQGYKPYIKIYVNLEDIFKTIESHIEQNKNSLTTFEAASLGDPLSLEHLTGSLAKTIEFFGTLDNGRLRVVTKFSTVDSLLDLKHKEHTRFRVSINSRYVIRNFEHNTADFDDRIEAAYKLASSGYPIGFIVAPIMLYDTWEEEYTELFDRLRQTAAVNKSGETITFELIQHRFTQTAKKIILERYPNTKLDMDESNRMLKWGKYGRFKYVYPKESAARIKEFISGLINDRFSNSRIEYFT